VEPEHQEQGQSGADILSDEVVAYWRARLMTEIDLDELGPLTDEQRLAQLRDAATRLLATEGSRLPAQQRDMIVACIVELALSSDSAAGLGIAQIYRQARQLQASKEARYDVRSGLSQLRKWMEEDVDSTQVATAGLTTAGQTTVTRGDIVTLEPISGQLVIAKAAFEAGTAAIQLSNTVIGRIKLRRMIQEAEKQQIQYWINEQLSHLRFASDVRLNLAAQDAIAEIWEKYTRAVARHPDAEQYHRMMFENTFSNIMRHARGS
jgi:hypothetical protein